MGIRDENDENNLGYFRQATILFNFSGREIIMNSQVVEIKWSILLWYLSSYS